MGKKRKLIEISPPTIFGQQRTCTCAFEGDAICHSCASERIAPAKKPWSSKHAPQEHVNPLSTVKSPISPISQRRHLLKGRYNNHKGKERTSPGATRRADPEIGASSPDAQPILSFSQGGNYSKSKGIWKKDFWKKRKSRPSIFQSWDIYQRFTSARAERHKNRKRPQSHYESGDMFNDMSETEENNDEVTKMDDQTTEMSPSQPCKVSEKNLLVKSEDPVDSEKVSVCSGSFPGNSMPPLRPLFFEVPAVEVKGMYSERKWLFREVEAILSSDQVNNRGVIISGNAGTGKTHTVLQLVDVSCFGRHSPINGDHQGKSSLLSLAPHIVAYHFCQMDNSISCLVPEFVHSLAAQLCQAPQLAMYNKYITENPSVLENLTMELCVRNPSAALVQGVLEPLQHLQRSNQLYTDYCVIVIDSVDEAEYHRAESGDTIASFLTKHIFRFPSWLKLVVTVGTRKQDLLSLIPFHKISLDGGDKNVEEDIVDYINRRLHHDSTIIGGADADFIHSLTKHLVKFSDGSMLQIKLTLDLIQSGYLGYQWSNMKTKSLPSSLEQVFLLLCESKFACLTAFEDVKDILSTCLAALNPLNLLEIYHSVNSLRTKENLVWEEFLERLKTLDGLLVQRSDATFMFFHAAFRDWLCSRVDGTTAFLCEKRRGHAAISFRLTRIEAPLNPSKTLQLAHHILKAHVYRSSSYSKCSSTPKDLQAIWLASASEEPSKALASQYNIYYPNVKVSRLILQAGANPNHKTGLEHNAPLLGMYAATGLVDLVRLLLEFGADASMSNDLGNTPLHMASEKGHANVVQILLNEGASPFVLNEHQECSLVKASEYGHLNVLSILLSSMWTQDVVSTRVAAQKALIVAAANGHIAVVGHILDNVQVSINTCDTIYGETALSIASSCGKRDVVFLLLNNGANPNELNEHDMSPLALASSQGHFEIVKMLLAHGAMCDILDGQKRTSLSLAAKEGRLDIVDILLNAGANVQSIDQDGLCPLSWATLRGQGPVVSRLILAKADISHADNTGRTALDLAASSGNEEITLILLENGALIEHVDLQGVRAIDRAVGCGHKAVVQLLLKRGAKLGPATWTMANGKPDIILCLLQKLLEDGNVLSRKGNLKAAAYRFQYAIKKVPDDYTEDMQTVFNSMKIALTLLLSRCKRKMKEYDESISLASEVLHDDPLNHKAYFIRAKARHSNKQHLEAYHDVSKALELNDYKESIKPMLRFQEDIKIILKGKENDQIPVSTSPNKDNFIGNDMPY